MNMNMNRYAAKEIQKSHLLEHKTGFNMLYSELDALTRIDHPFIVKLFFAFHTEHKCYFVLDLKTGLDLRHYLRKKLLFEEINVAFYVACIGSALHFCHTRNVIHRDVKPENIILDENGFPHLIDFGVSYVEKDDAKQYLTCQLASGTKQYLAPEVFTKAHVHGPEVDFWALGVVAYELLNGSRPFAKHCPPNMIQYLEKGLSRRAKTENVQRSSLIDHTKELILPKQVVHVSRANDYELERSEIATVIDNLKKVEVVRNQATTTNLQHLSSSSIMNMKMGSSSERCTPQKLLSIEEKKEKQYAMVESGCYANHYPTSSKSSILNSSILLSNTKAVGQHDLVKSQKRSDDSMTNRTIIFPPIHSSPSSLVNDNDRSPATINNGTAETKAMMDSSHNKKVNYDTTVRCSHSFYYSFNITHHYYDYTHIYIFLFTHYYITSANRTYFFKIL